MARPEEVRVSDSLTISGDELTWKFSPARGPGGQHVNRSATRATLIFDVVSSRSLDDDQRQRVLAAVEGRSHDGVLSVSEESSRSQWRNRQMAKAHLAELIREALAPPPPPRRTGGPPRRARRARLDAKRRRGEVKRLRHRPDEQA